MIRNIFPDSRIVMLEALPMLEGPIKEVIKAVGNAEYKITVRIPGSCTCTADIELLRPVAWQRHNVIYS